MQPIPAGGAQGFTYKDPSGEQAELPAAASRGLCESSTEIIPVLFTTGLMMSFVG